MVTVIKNWKMVESSVDEGPNVPENAGKMVGPQYRPTHRGLRSAAVTQTGKWWRKCVSISPMLYIGFPDCLSRKNIYQEIKNITENQ